MTKAILKWFVAIIGSSVLAILSGVLPCYLLPSIGKVHWCGYKSDPPYFFTQLLVGFVVGIVSFSYVLFIRTRPKKENTKKWFLMGAIGSGVLTWLSISLLSPLIFREEDPWPFQMSYWDKVRFCAPRYVSVSLIAGLFFGYLLGKIMRKAHRKVSEPSLFSRN